MVKAPKQRQSKNYHKARVRYARKHLKVVVVHCNYFGNGIVRVLGSIHHYYTGLSKIVLIAVRK